MDRKKLILESLQTKKEFLKVDKRAKDLMNREIYKLIKNTYFPSIPIKEIFQILENHHYIAIQEDGTKWEGFLAGDSGRAQIEIALDASENQGTYTPCEDAVLLISWYRMQSGRYEINAYLS